MLFISMIAFLNYLLNYDSMIIYFNMVFFFQVCCLKGLLMTLTCKRKANKMEEPTSNGSTSFIIPILFFFFKDSKRMTKEHFPADHTRT